MKKALVLCVLLFAGCSGQTKTDADWPQWRGPQRDGISMETGLLQAWPEEGPKLLWRVDDIGDGYSTPAVVGSQIYIMSNRGMENEFVQSLSIEDGSTAWTTKIGNVGNPDQQPSFPAARSTPTVDGEFLYALGSDGDLACLEKDTGRIVWQKSLREDFGGMPGTWAYSESPLVDGDAVIVAPGGAQATLAALNKATGEVIWTCAVPGGDPAGYASTIAIQAAGRKQYVQFLDQGVVGVDAATGQFLWRYDEPGKSPANMPTPVSRGDYVYASKARIGGGLAKLTATEDGVAAEEVYFKRDLPYSLGGSILEGDYLYGTTDKGMVAVEFLTGEILWQDESIGAGSVLLADGCLYVHGENGEVALVEATPEAYREKGRFTTPDPPAHKQEMEKSWAYPVVSNGRLYLRDMGTLWCYDIKAAD